jgi:hypothetical protein
MATITTPHPFDLGGYRRVRDNVERDLRARLADLDLRALPPGGAERFEELLRAEAHRYALELARHLIPVDRADRRHA